MPSAASAAARAGSKSSGSPVSFAIVAGSELSATRRPSLLPGASAGSHAPPATLVPLATGQFHLGLGAQLDRGRDPHRLERAGVMQPQDRAPRRRRQRGRGGRGPLALL